MEFSKEELSRYNRQIIIPGFGLEGQKKLKNAKVFIAGIGGLGSISSYYLAAAGVGHLKIVDKDRVDYSNLNRQIIHWTGDIGEYKSDSAYAKLKEFNPECTVEAVQEEIRENNCERLIGDCSVIVDAMDNMPARKILNAVSVKKKIPYVYGGVHQLDGMVSSFLPGETPCLECVFPDTGTVSDPTPTPILGPVPGVVASLQTIETVKILLDFETPLAGRLLSFSGTDMTFREFRIKKDPDCPVCGKTVGSVGNG